MLESAFQLADYYDTHITDFYCQFYFRDMFTLLYWVRRTFRTFLGGEEEIIVNTIVFVKNKYFVSANPFRVHSNENSGI